MPVATPAEKQQFLQQFEASLTGLGGVHAKISASIAQKKQFSDQLLVKLRAINDHIKALAGEITRLKGEVDGLQGQVHANTASIGNKDKEVADLTQKITALNAEKQLAEQHLTELQNQHAAQQTALQQEQAQKQQRIDEIEAQMRTLTAENDNLKAQADALTKELAGHGDVQATHAAEIQRLTQESQQKLAEQQQANQVEIQRLEQESNALHQEISEKTDIITHLQQQLAAKTAEAESHTKNIASTQEQTQQQIEQLTQQITALEAENNDYLERIKAATQAIHQATAALEALENSIPPDAETGRNVDALFDEINQSIQNISGVIQGRVPANAPPQPVPSAVAKNPKLPLSTPFNYLNKQFTLGELITDLRSKPSNNALGVLTPYALSLQQLSGATDAGDITYILQKNGIKLTKNGKISGGNRTKKNRRKKQKGGFTYRHTKRRSITSSRKHSKKSTAKLM